MTLSLKYYNKSIGFPAEIIELSVYDIGCKISSDITDCNGFVSEGLISNLREIASDLEEQNKLNKEYLGRNNQ